MLHQKEVIIMDNEKNEAAEQKNLTIEEQQQAYFNAMKAMEAEKQKEMQEWQAEKKKKRKKKALIILGIIAVCVLAIATVSVSNMIIAKNNPIYSAALTGNALLYGVDETAEENRTKCAKAIEEAINAYVGDKDIKNEEIQQYLYKQAKLTLKKDVPYGAVLILGYCQENDDVNELLKKANYEAGKEFKKMGNSVIAAKHLWNSEDYKDGTELAKEYTYEYILEQVRTGNWGGWLKASTYAGDKRMKGYKETAKLYVWTKTQALCCSKAELAEVAIKNACKDPASYQKLSDNTSFSFNEKKTDSSKAEFKVNINIRYSATNSFGGRVSDTFQETIKMDDIDLMGLSYDEAFRVVGLSTDELLKECEVTE